MKKKIAVCGLDCGECPAYQATQRNDDGQRQQVAESWSKEYHADIKWQDIDCDGCTAGGRLFHYPRVCEIRSCGMKRKFANCSACDDFPCSRLSEFFKRAPQAEANLREIRGMS